MNADLYTKDYGQIQLNTGWPPAAHIPLLPFAKGQWKREAFGSIYLQEVSLRYYRFRYFIFSFLQPMTLTIRERGEGVQSLLTLKGSFHYRFTGQKFQTLQEGQFTLLNAGHAETETTIPALKECHLLNTYYGAESFEPLFSLLPRLKKDIARSTDRPRFFLPFPRPARYSVMDAVRQIFNESYKSSLQKRFWELKLEQAQFTQWAQAYTEKPGRLSTTQEKEIALKIRELILSDIRVHHTVESIAQQVGFSVSTVKRAFNQSLDRVSMNS